MIIFLACLNTAYSYQEVKDRFFQEGTDPELDELRSYFEISEFTGHTLPRRGRSFFLDSGAFSAWSQGTPVDIKRYANFLLKYGDQMDHFANLDAIPEGPDDLERSAKETMDNQLFLEGYGLKPIPVYHRGEPWKYLEYYLEHNEYICLGGLVAEKSTGTNEGFFDMVWDKYLTDGAGRPTHKVHAFGMTSLRLVRTYPWFSVDSSTWLIAGKVGCVWIPIEFNGNGYDYNRPPLALAVSEKSGARKWDGYHFETFSKEHQEAIYKYLELKDISMEELRTKTQVRMVGNLTFWIDFAKNATFAETFQSRQVELL